MSINAVIVLAQFVTGGSVTLALYATVWLCPPPGAMDRPTVWGFMAHYRCLFTMAAVIAAVAVCAFFALTLLRETPPSDLCVAATGVFFVGAIGWPAAVLSNWLPGAKVAVGVAASGSVLLLVDAALTLADNKIVAAAAVSAVQHGVVDVLWAVLTPPGGAMLADALLP